jgi:N-methylhydantoinase B
MHAVHPAPVAMRHTIGQLLPDLVLGCLHQAMPGAVPAEGASCMWDIPIRSVAMFRPGQNSTRFAIELTHNGGTGARPSSDGLSATAYPSGVWGSQVEMSESVVPIRFKRRELIPDSGGAGKFRGGLGQTIEIESREGVDMMLFASVDRMKYPARGRDKGRPGAVGRITLGSGRALSGKGEQLIPAGDTLIFETPGGGGYGDPHERAREALLEDVRCGLVSPDAALRDYGMSPDRP